MFEALFNRGIGVRDLTEMLHHDENVIADLLRPPTGNADQIRVSYDPALHERLTRQLSMGQVRARLTLVSEGPTETISMTVVRVYRDGNFLVLDNLHF